MTHTRPRSIGSKPITIMSPTNKPPQLPKSNLAQQELRNRLKSRADQHIAAAIANGRRASGGKA